MLVRLKTVAFFVVFAVMTSALVSAHEGHDIKIKFEAVVGNQVAACGESYEGVGLGESTIQLNDFRFYVSNVRLINKDGEEVALELEPDTIWQVDNVALLDFEDGTATCAEAGTPELNDVIIGAAPEGEYTGIVFDIGVPFELNHQDTTVAASPLNLPAMWWNWQYGYKYVRVDMSVAEGESDAWFIHLGATGCEVEKDAAAPTEECANPNRVTVQLDEFDYKKDTIVFDLAGLLAETDLSKSVPMPPGCMSGTDDTDCAGVFTGFGLDLATGLCPEESAVCETQTAFSVKSEK